MEDPRIPVKPIQQAPLIELGLIDTKRQDGKFYLTVEQARELRIDLDKVLKKLDGLA